MLAAGARGGAGRMILDELKGRNVVLDVASPYVYLGRLAGWDEKYLALEDADVHDLRDTKTSRERYVVDSRLHGIKANRRRVLVSRAELVSFSLLDDVLI